LWDRVPTQKKTQVSQSLSGKYDPTFIFVVFQILEVLCENYFFIFLMIRTLGVFFMFVSIRNILGILRSSGLRFCLCVL
jgi:hypothetical protein